MRNTKTPKGVARLLVRGLKAMHTTEQWPEELELLASAIDEMSMVCEMQADNCNSHGQSRQDADWLCELYDELESLAPATEEA